MNKRGHPQTLVASHPGNMNALKHGVHSPRAIQARSAEIVDELTQRFEFSPAQRLAVLEVARCMAVLEAIDRELDEHGLEDKRGKPRHLLDHRWRASRQLDHWLRRITDVIEASTSEDELPVTRDDYLRALRRIALGQDSSASVRDRLRALKELLETGDGDEIGHPQGEVHDVVTTVDPEGNTLSSAYDEAGNLIRVISARPEEGRLIRLERDEDGRFTETTYPLSP